MHALEIPRNAERERHKKRYVNSPYCFAQQKNRSRIEFHGETIHTDDGLLQPHLSLPHTKNGPLAEMVTELRALVLGLTVSKAYGTAVNSTIQKKQAVFHPLLDIPMNNIYTKILSSLACDVMASDLGYPQLYILGRLPVRYTTSESSALRRAT
ncbi:uncharacterized protein BO95DRAFT_428801 [Aspergillus brunneoviolaceus CBS 621.78]|uniref:Uncharacterized protein n=1 Tax=Aspergillus brunneoviolaceus CBS 621.78 TaxID=1450534 RepID=A0ACD1GIB0_9EURO|nr:hypothetical protein BO95DRAFT_428801 [Aspergillus brunneoviolaceus CBS 621.78]RAH48981.1 hypothetical protein BO95DRAFT_428801 [Aspergillus brunneoviolaceus CBS 621.78]